MLSPVSSVFQHTHTHPETLSAITLLSETREQDAGRESGIFRTDFLSLSLHMTSLTLLRDVRACVCVFATLHWLDRAVGRRHELRWARITTHTHTHTLYTTHAPECETLLQKNIKMQSYFKSLEITVKLVRNNNLVFGYKCQLLTLVKWFIVTDSWPDLCWEAVYSFFLSFSYPSQCWTDKCKTFTTVLYYCYLHHTKPLATFWERERQRVMGRES